MSLSEVRENKDAVITAIKGDTKWTGRIVLYYTAVSLLLAFIAYHVGMLIW